MTVPAESTEAEMFPPVVILSAVRAPADTEPEMFAVEADILSEDEIFPETLTGDDMAIVPPAFFEAMVFVLVTAKSPVFADTVPEADMSEAATVPAETVPVVVMFPAPVFRLAAVSTPVVTFPEKVPEDADMLPVVEKFPATAVSPSTLRGADTAIVPPSPCAEMEFVFTAFAETSPLPSSHSRVAFSPIWLTAYLSTKKLNPAVAPGRVTMKETSPPDTSARGRKFGIREADVVSSVVLIDSSFSP